MTMNQAMVNNKYRITRRIGGGSFGEIYMGAGPSSEKVAIKFERQGSRCPQLRHEYKVYRELANSIGFCSVYYFGAQENYNVMVMDLLGPSLEDLFTRCSRRFSLKTVLQIADQILERIDCLHQRHLIHRDIKPANFTIGINETSSSIFCVDFGLSKRYRHPKTLQHIPHRDGRSLTGTPRYASINNHLGIEQSRRDDLESVGYILVYFLKGALPWQGLKAKNAQKKYRLILEKKQQVSIAQLCSGLPSQFAEFLAYSRSLKFDAKPDIPYLRKLFRDLYHAQGLSSIGKVWDWDDMEMDYGDGTTPTGAGAMLPGVLTSTPSGLLRPNTAAAVGNGGMMDGDMYGGDGYDDMGGMGAGYERTRPSTTGGNPVNPSNPSNPKAPYQPTNGVLPTPTTANPAGGWAYGRPAVMTSMNANPTAQDAMITNDSGAGFQPRRPHTAHGGRGGEDKGLPAPGTAHATAGGDEEEGEDHVVAGARAMMRYRRTKTDTAPTGNQPVNLPTTTRTAVSSAYEQAIAPQINYSGKQSSYSGAIPTGRMNQQAVYPTRSQIPTSTTSSGARQSIMTTASGVGTNTSSTQGATSGWSMIQGDRPKSATNNAPIPSGSSSKLFSNGNSTQGVTVAANSSGALPSSYGAMKSRFLVRDGAQNSSHKIATLASGLLPASTGNPHGTSGISGISGSSAANMSTTSGSAARSSKLFGLTR